MKFVKKHLTQILLIIVIVLLFANLISNQGFVFGISIFKPTPTPTAISPTQTPEVTPTPSPKPTIKVVYKATSTPNPAIQNRINEIDQQLVTNSQAEQKISSSMQQGQNCKTTSCLVGMTDLANMLENLLNQDQQLKAEKTQLLIQQN